MPNAAPPGSLALVDVSTWLDGTWSDESSATVDRALRTTGFLLVSGHGVPIALAAEARRVARQFFALPDDVKGRYASPSARGWKAPASVANARSEGLDTPPDLHESFMIGRSAADLEALLDRAGADPAWFPDNIWPSEVPELVEVLVEYREHMERLGLILMDIMARSLGLDDGYFRRFLDPAVGSLAINWYPCYQSIGAPRVGQFRIGPHSDFGSITILDRQTAKSGLQVQALDGSWESAPFVPGALTINTGDLLARWTGDRWRSTKHRVPPTTADAPAEELLSLVFFYDVDPTARIETLPEPIAGPRRYEPVLAGDYLRAKIDAIQTG